MQKKEKAKNISFTNYFVDFALKYTHKVFPKMVCILKTE